VTGYANNEGKKLALFTHSNEYSSIYTDGRINYDINSKRSQRGCPVYRNGDKKVVGIHKAYDPLTLLNFATKITESVIAVLK
jgi:hypothetical protein